MRHLVVATFNHIHVYQAQHIIISCVHSFFCQIYNVINVRMLWDTGHQTEPVAFSCAHIIHISILCQAFTDDSDALTYSSIHLSHAHSIHPYPYKYYPGKAD